MKGLALGVVTLGLLLAFAAPSSAHEHWGGYYHGHYYQHYYGGYGYPGYYGRAAVVVAPAPVYGYGYAAYPPPPVVAPVVPGPVYYGPSYGPPAVSFGLHTRGLSVGVGL